MPSPFELCRGHDRLVALVMYALREGWTVTHTPGGHMTFTKPGLPTVYTGSITSIPRTGYATRPPGQRIAPRAVTGPRTGGGDA